MGRLGKREENEGNNGKPKEIKGTCRKLEEKLGNLSQLGQSNGKLGNLQETVRNWKKLEYQKESIRVRVLERNKGKEK